MKIILTSEKINYVEGDSLGGPSAWTRRWEAAYIAMEWMPIGLGQYFPFDVEELVRRVHDHERGLTLMSTDGTRSTVLDWEDSGPETGRGIRPSM